MDFEWDDPKNDANFAAHGIWFEEAQTVFCDPNLIDNYDPDHSQDEDRYITIGWSNARMIFISYHVTENGNFRIISARKVTKTERKEYEG